VLKIARSSRYAPAALVGRSLATRPNQERTWAGRTFPIDGGPAPQLARQRVPKDVMGVAVAVAAQRLADDGFVGPVTVETGQSSPVGTMGLRVRRRGCRPRRRPRPVGRSWCRWPDLALQADGMGIVPHVTRLGLEGLVAARCFHASEHGLAPGALHERIDRLPVVHRPIPAGGCNTSGQELDPSKSRVAFPVLLRKRMTGPPLRRLRRRLGGQIRTLA
jgi:hypothetical protein